MLTNSSLKSNSYTDIGLNKEERCLEIIFQRFQSRRLHPSFLYQNLKVIEQGLSPPYEDRECLLDESSEPLFEVVSKLGRRIKISKLYWNHITKVKHTTVLGLEEQAQNSLKTPVEVRKSKIDPYVYLYYGKVETEANPLICTVVKHLNGEGYVITIYLTRRMTGDVAWKSS